MVINTIPRRIKSSSDVILFFPDAEANPGFILSYMEIGQHSEASLPFYANSTKPVTFPDAEVEQLMFNYCRNYDVLLYIQKRRSRRAKNTYRR